MQYKKSFIVRIGEQDYELNKKKGGLRKIRDIKPPCLSPSHNPPNMIVLSPGEYEYICPACGFTQYFTVPYIYW